MRLMLYLLLLLGLIEESVLKVLKINKTFNNDLFSKILKKTTYNCFESDDKNENINEIVSNIRLNYDYGEVNSDHSVENVLNQINGLNEDDIIVKLKDIGILNQIQLDVKFNEDNTIDFNIPIHLIIEVLTLENYVEKEQISMLEINQDLNLIDSIWDRWQLEEMEIKEVVDYFLENLGVNKE